MSHRMSLYDNFRAPQYVDFENLLLGDANTDTSSFFERGSENVSNFSSNGKSNDSIIVDASVVSFFNNSYSDNEETLTPGKVDDGLLKGINSPVKMSCDSELLSCETPVEKRIGCFINTSTPVVEKSCHQAVTSVENDAIDTHGRELAIHVAVPGTSLDHSEQCDTAIKTSQVSLKLKRNAVKINIIPATPNTSHQLSPCPNSSASPATPSRCKPRNTASKCQGGSRRRSKSAENPIQSYTPEMILEHALQCMVLECEPEKFNSKELVSEQEVNANSSFSPQLALLSSVPSVTRNARMSQKTVQRGAQPKRKLSPVARDYSQPPEKYASLAENDHRIQKETQSRFRTTYMRSSLKAATLSKGEKNVGASKRLGDQKLGLLKSDNKAGGPSRTVEDEDQKDGKLKSVKGVKVPRWPAPKIEPFKYAEYKSKDLPKTVFYFDNMEQKLLRDRSTPLKRMYRGPTKPEPFSFEERDKLYLQRKLERINGVHLPDDQFQTRSRTVRRRSMSQDGAGEKLPGARVPLVLYKPPFVPKKAHFQPTKPVELKLSTELRAKEREVFEMHLREKQDLLADLLHKKHEEQKLAEEEEVKKLRKNLIHKPRLVPSYDKFHVHSSRIPLTVPQTPPILHRSQRCSGKVKNDVPVDEPMEV